MKFFLTCIATLLFAVTSAFAQFTADERITYFESEVVINPDATLDVTETITVNVAGQQIQRGIFRDFPTRYKDRLGNNITVGFDVIDVKRNGKAENYTLQSLSNGVRIRIGRADAILNHGPHTYTIRYQTNRQLGFFKNFDELYWNVTGNDWDFVIDRAKAIIHLPQGATITQRAAYTGPQGAQGQDFTISDITRPLRIETTRALQPGEGLTIAVAWPKGFVTEPSAADEAAYLARDNQGLSVLFLGLLVVAGYYYQAWSQYGRDPEGGAIFPRYKPPAGLSPAATRFIWKMGYDKKAFTAALINMAVKGALTIEEKASGFTLKHNKGMLEEKLSPGESRIRNTLFSGVWKSIDLKQKNHKTISSAINSLSSSLENEYEGIHFHKNRKFFYIGAGLSVLAIITSFFFIESGEETIFFCVWISIWSMGCAALASKVYYSWKAVTAGVPMAIAGAIFITLFSLPFFIAEIVVLGIIASDIGALFMLLFLSVIATNAAFFYLLKSPTRAGRAIMDEIEGFRLYISVAEQPHLDAMTPPRKTPELFEKFLPYAIALEVDNQWGEQFSGILDSATSTDPDRRGYRPSWYRGNSWDRVGAGGFGNAVGNSLANTIASSSRAPGSSSGSGGGGSSGGGGGGGGGGGW